MDQPIRLRVAADHGGLDQCRHDLARVDGRARRRYVRPPAAPAPRANASTIETAIAAHGVSSDGAATGAGLGAVRGAGVKVFICAAIWCRAGRVLGVRAAQVLRLRCCDRGVAGVGHAQVLLRERGGARHAQKGDGGERERMMRNTVSLLGRS